MGNDFAEIQEQLRKNNIDAWVLYDFRGSNSIAWKILGIPTNTHCTRRWVVIIPAYGSATKIVSAIEPHSLESVPALELQYANRTQWEESITTALLPYQTIAMEYSPLNAVPVVSKVDAGTIEWFKSLGKKVVTSADIAQYFQAVWTVEQLHDNKQTSELLYSAMLETFSFMSEKLKREMLLTEFDVQQHIMRFFGENGLVTYSEPIVAIGVNSANPHYAPSPDNNGVIKKGETVLIDMWAKSSKPNSTYSDITWMTHADSSVPGRVGSLFSIISKGRDSALQLVKQRFENNVPIAGYEVDDACRLVIQDAGYGDYFIHRTGHNIGEETHGAGANMDNFETHDTRTILNGTSFSIEPGIYIPNDIGLRTEIDVVIGLDGSVNVTSPIQESVHCLL